MTLNAARTFLQPITIWVNMIFVTWRLRGSLRQRPRCASAAAIEKALDRDTGERLLLAEPMYARRVRDALLNGDREKGYFDLHAWVVLHNHVHALLDPHTGTVRIAETVMDMSEQSSGRRFWERESWERPVRTQEEYLKSMEYIHKHPVGTVWCSGRNSGNGRARMRMSRRVALNRRLITTLMFRNASRLLCGCELPAG